MKNDEERMSLHVASQIIREDLKTLYERMWALFLLENPETLTGMDYLDKEREYLKFAKIANMTFAKETETILALDCIKRAIKMKDKENKDEV